MSMFNCSHTGKKKVFYKNRIMPEAIYACCLLSCHPVLLHREYLHLLCPYLVGTVGLQLCSTSVELSPVVSLQLEGTRAGHSFLCGVPGSARWRETITSLHLLPVPLLLKHWMGMTLAAVSLRVALMHLAVPRTPGQH